MKDKRASKDNRTYADILHSLVDSQPGDDFFISDKERAEMHEVLDDVGLTRTPTEESDD